MMQNFQTYRGDPNGYNSKTEERTSLDSMHSCCRLLYKEYTVTRLSPHVQL